MKNATTTRSTMEPERPTLPRRLALLLAGVLTALLAAPAAAQEHSGSGGEGLVDQALGSGPIDVAAPFAGLGRDALRLAPYTDDALGIAAALPVQDGGRIKPLSTMAGFRLLKLHGKRRAEVQLPYTDGPVRLGATEWLLDTLFFPRQSERYRVFTVADDAVLTAIGLEFEGRKRRDRYSYVELAPARAELMAVAQQVSEVDDAARTAVDRQVLRLALQLREYEDLLGAFEFARVELPLDATGFLRETFTDPRPGVTVLFEHLDVLRERWNAAEIGALPADEAERAAEVGREIQFGFGRATELANLGPGLLPPHEPVEERKAWLDPGEVLTEAASGTGDVEDGLPLLRRIEEVEAAKHDPAEFEAALGRLSASIQERAEARGEYAKVPLEVTFYAWNFFFWALALFLLGFLFVAASWIRPLAGLTVGAWVANGAGLAMLVAGITFRCILRERPPVSTLYETILFITAGVVAVALFIEYVMRQRAAIGVAAFLGALGMFLGNRYEFREALSNGDTMTSLQAVLDTNFWLATHVTTVTLGYSAGLLAAVFSLVWLGLRMAGFRREDRAFFTGWTRATYGVLCFGLLLSTVGTILGGVWANDSWGRFWGWDPKENGALMIVLWELMILHSRLGGYVRQFGLHMLSIALGPVVAFSWWHVNLLGVGLHSYGFTDGVMNALLGYYGLSALALFVGLMWYSVVGEQAANGVPPRPGSQAPRPSEAGA